MNDHAPQATIPATARLDVTCAAGIADEIRRHQQIASAQAVAPGEILEIHHRPSTYGLLTRSAPGRTAAAGPGASQPDRSLTERIAGSILGSPGRNAATNPTSVPSVASTVFILADSPDRCRVLLDRYVNDLQVEYGADRVHGASSFTSYEREMALAAEPAAELESDDEGLSMA